jgi:hypothetical protein
VINRGRTTAPAGNPARYQEKLCDSTADDRYEPFALIDPYVEAFFKIHEHQDELGNLAANELTSSRNTQPGSR